MKLHKQNIPTTLALSLVLVLAAVPAPGADVSGDALATMSGLGDQMAWVPTGQVERLALRVSGPGTTVLERFDGGAAAVFSLYDAEGNARPDGSYTWELREEFGPVNADVRDADNGRDTAAHEGGSRAELSGRLQWGSFRVENGALVDSSLVEARPSRPTKD